MLNVEISVVTITLNDSKGLLKTLYSLSKLNVKPREIIVIDGGTEGFEINYIQNIFSLTLPQLTINSESDEGIYDAMNKGKEKCLGSLVHYLNSGDIVFGEPYENLKHESILPVKFLDEEGNECGVDRVKFFGTAYNHQGIIFNKNHSPYNLNYKIAADYVSILESFPSGLKNLQVTKNGGVQYSFGGLSTKKSFYGTMEMIMALIIHRPLLSIVAIPAILFKTLIPRKIRRFLLKRIKN